MQKLKSFVLSVALVMLVTGCASQANKDPLEGMNRAVYKFNDTADKAVLKRVAGAYKAVVPSPIRSGVGNFFNNLNTFVSMINNLLQFKFANAMNEAGRFAVNSTFGIAGIFDLASKDGMPKYQEDFGQTLGHWGVGSGAYLVLPFLGPSSLRDTSGFVVDTFAFDPISYIDEPATRNSLRALNYLDKRAQYLPASDLLDDAALDPYSFMRDAYFQRRANQVADHVVSGNADGFEPADEPAEKVEPAK